METNAIQYREIDEDGYAVGLPICSDAATSGRTIQNGKLGRQ